LFESNADLVGAACPQCPAAGAAANDDSFNSDDGVVEQLKYDIGWAPPLRLFGKNYTAVCVSANGGVRLYAPENPSSDFSCPVDANFPGAITIPSVGNAGIFPFWMDLDSSKFNMFAPIPGYTNAVLDTVYCAFMRDGGG
jgi:hypothetical protein